MNRRIGVALNALARRAAETIVDVTFGARDLGVLAVEREHGGVIESL